MAEIQCLKQDAGIARSTRDGQSDFTPDRPGGHHFACFTWLGLTRPGCHGPLPRIFTIVFQLFMTSFQCQFLMASFSRVPHCP